MCEPGVVEIAEDGGIGGGLHGKVVMRVSPIEVLLFVALCTECLIDIGGRLP